MTEELKKLFGEHAHVLDSRMQEIVRMRLEGKTLQEIGLATPNRQAGKRDRLHNTTYRETLSAERVRQLLAVAAHRMKLDVRR